MGRQVLAQRQQESAGAQSAQHSGQISAPAKRGQGQRDHAGAHVEVVRQGQIV